MRLHGSITSTVDARELATLGLQVSGSDLVSTLGDVRHCDRDRLLASWRPTEDDTAASMRLHITVVDVAPGSAHLRVIGSRSDVSAEVEVHLASSGTDTEPVVSWVADVVVLSRYDGPVVGSRQAISSRIATTLGELAAAARRVRDGGSPYAAR